MVDTDTLARLRAQVQDFCDQAESIAATAGDRGHMVRYHYNSGRAAAFRQVLEALQQMDVDGQCSWCLQRDVQAFAFVCPTHVNDWRALLDDLQVDLRALCQAVGEFDGARPESPQVILQICTERAREWRRLAAEQREDGR